MDRDPTSAGVPQLLDLVARHNWTVALDLKGSDRSPHAYTIHLLHLARDVLARRLQQRVWLWVEGTGAARSIRRQLRANASVPQPPLILLKPLRDRALPAPLDCAAAHLERGDERIFQMLGPSRHCVTPRFFGNAWVQHVWGARHRRDLPTHHADTRVFATTAGHRLAREAAAGAALLVWVVDDVAELTRLLRHGVRHVVSNRPVALQEAACK